MGLESSCVLLSFLVSYISSSSPVLSSSPASLLFSSSVASHSALPHRHRQARQMLRSSSISTSGGTRGLLSGPWLHLAHSSGTLYLLFILLVTPQPSTPFIFSSYQVQFAKNIPLDQDETTNGQKAAFLMACIGITSGIACHHYILSTHVFILFRYWEAPLWLGV